ncbi:MAG TPA: hypothetical protein V6D17_20135 [Candidatus Obscuribacterales bacterium]
MPLTIVLFVLAICAAIAKLCIVLLPAGTAGIGTLIAAFAVYFGLGMLNAKVADSPSAALKLGLIWGVVGSAVAAIMYLLMI